MDILLPSVEGRSAEDFIHSICSQNPLLPFDNILVEFITEVSRSILSNQSFRAYPELMAMAYWLRPSHIKEIRDSYEAQRMDRVWLAKGVILHFAPANVDSIFIYSWFLAMLVGNASIVRLSQNRGKQICVLIELLGQILEKNEYQDIKRRTMIVSYGHEEETSYKLSQVCQLRVIWGGDETVKQIRSIPLPSSAADLVFGDKFSLAAFNAEAVLSASDSELLTLANNFYNDVFWFDQLACSSPKVLIWIGTSTAAINAKARFWPAFSVLINEKGSKWGPEVGMTRLVTACSFAAMGWVDKILSSDPSLPYRLPIASLSESIRQNHCGGGLLLEMERTALNDLVRETIGKDQTMSVFGFSEDELRNFAWQLGGRGLDRIVPVGKALEFGTVWDGNDLLRSFVREVSILR